MKKLLTLLSTLLVLGCWFTPVTVFATQGAAGTPQPIVDVSFPCPNEALGLGACGNPASNDIAGYILRFYQFGVAIAGILAVGLIVAGSVYISASGGSPDKQSEGKDMITSAIWGLVLLFGSYLILNTVNPEIVTLKNPNVTLQELPVCIYDEAKDPDHKNPLVKGEHGEFLENEPCKPPITEIALKNECAPFKDIPSYSGEVPQGSCASRQAIALQVFTVSRGDYYGEYEEILKNSDIWLYPYFKRGYPDTARCLVYAYQSDEKNDGKTEMIELNPGLELCATQPLEPQEAEIACDPNQLLPWGTLTNDSAVSRLAAAGISVDSTGHCDELCKKSCTSLQGIPESAVQKLEQLSIACRQMIGCTIAVTGGTEVGHQSHGAGLPVVDLSFNGTLANLLKNNASKYGIVKICTTADDAKVCAAAEDATCRLNCSTNEKESHLHVEFSP